GSVASKIGISQPHSALRSGPAIIFYRRIVRPALGHFPRVKSNLLQFMGSNRRPAGKSELLPQRRRLSHDEVLWGLEDSTKRLKRSFVDLYLLHEPDQFMVTDELFELFCRLKRDRVVGAFG